MTDISRRKLFGAAGAASLGLAGMVPVASASECGKPVKWNETKEFVIIGTGFAGLAAALEAHQGGMKADQILILEKMSFPGGNSVINGGAVAAAGTDMQKAEGIKDSPDLLYADIIKAGGGLAHPELARHIADESVENFYWLRDKIGVVYGNPEVTTGGRALKYYSSVRIDIRRVEGLKDSSGQFIGNHTRAKIVKNKVAPPFREAEFDIMFGEGISKMSELIDVGVKLGIVQKSGAWFNYGDIRLGQGRDNAKQFLKDNPEIANDIEGQIRANADKLYATRRPAGKAAAAAAEKEEGGETASASKEPVVKAPARSSESELDIMVED